MASRLKSRTKYSRKKNGKKTGKKKKSIPSRKPAKLDSAVPAVCSECYGDFHISTNPSKNDITCPTCGHVGIVEEGCFANVSEKQSAHRKNFLLAISFNVIAFLCVSGWGFLNSWPLAEVTQKGVVDGLGETTNMILMGSAVVFLLIGFFMVNKYEKNRVEVYF